MFIAQTIDVGCPQLAMHSIRELGDTSSIHYATTLFSVGAAGEIFFFCFLYKNMNFFEIFSNFSNQKTKVKIPGKNELILRIIFFSGILQQTSQRSAGREDRARIKKGLELIPLDLMMVL